MGLTGGIGYPDNQPDSQADRWGVFHSKVSHNAHWSKWSSGVWFAGGSKFTQSFGMTVEDNYFAYNFGHGIWFDVGNHGAKIINNHSEYNSHSGIFYEISFDGLIKNNRVNHNGLAHGRDGGAGILVYSSPHTAVINNISVKNKTGVAFHHEPRTTSIWEPKKQKHWLPWPQGQDLAGWTPWPTVNGLTARGLRIENNVFSNNKADIANFTNNCQFLRNHTANMVIRNNRYSTAGLKIVWGAKNTPCGQKVITSLAAWEKQYGFGQNSTLLDNVGGH
jgi:hypothetical protein